MDKLSHYRQCVQRVLTNHSNYQSQPEEVESELIFDEGRNRYQLMRVGWNGLKRVYHSVMHFDIKVGRFGFSKIRRMWMLLRSWLRWGF
jgi:XisI protein